MGLFDFNRDGKTGMFEALIGLSILDSLCREEEDEWEEDEDWEEESAGDEEAEEVLSEQDEETLNRLRDELSDLEDELFEVEDDEPDDVSSEAYARWEQRRDLLEEKIACVEEQIDELEW